MTGFTRWMEESSVGDDEIAAAVNADRSTISRVRRLKRKPSRELLEALIVFSERMVAEGRARRCLEANDFFPRLATPNQAEGEPARCG
jgi:hypothetical protein